MLLHLALLCLLLIELQVHLSRQYIHTSCNPVKLVHTGMCWCLLCYVCKANSHHWWYHLSKHRCSENYIDSAFHLHACIAQSKSVCASIVRTGHGMVRLLIMIAVLVTSCVTMGGPGTSARNVQCWVEALTLARKHHDVVLEGMATKCIGGVAQQYG